MKTLLGIALAVIVGVALGLAINFVWWLEDANPAAWGAVIGIFATLSIQFVIKIGKEVR